MYVADTHTIAWYLTADDELGEIATDVLEQADDNEVEVILPTVVLAEVLYLARRKNVSFDAVVEKIRENAAYSTYPLTFRVVKTMQELDTDYSIHDAVIVATTDLLDATLLTADETIQQADDVETAW